MKQLLAKIGLPVMCSLHIWNFFCAGYDQEKIN